MAEAEKKRTRVECQNGRNRKGGRPHHRTALGRSSVRSAWIGLLVQVNLCVPVNIRLRTQPQRPVQSFQASLFPFPNIGVNYVSPQTVAREFGGSGQRTSVRPQDERVSTLTAILISLMICESSLRVRRPELNLGLQSLLYFSELFLTYMPVPD